MRTVPPPRWRGCWCLLLALLLAPAQDPAPSPASAFAAAMADYEAGRFAAAYAGFAAQLAAAAEPVPAALRWNTALAALRVLRSGAAESAIAPWREAAEPVLRAEAEFVFGLAQCQRAEQAAAAAALPDAEPLAWQLALAAQDRGSAAFERAVQLRGDWPEAVRNAERAQRRRRELEQQRDRSQPEAAQQEAVPEPPPPSPPGPADQPPEDVLPEAVTTEPTAVEINGLLQQLARKDQRKHQLRQQQQRSTAVAGERDW